MTLVTNHLIPNEGAASRSGIAGTVLTIVARQDAISPLIRIRGESNLLAKRAVTSHDLVRLVDGLLPFDGFDSRSLLGLEPLPFFGRLPRPEGGVLGTASKQQDDQITHGYLSLSGQRRSVRRMISSPRQTSSLGVGCTPAGVPPPAGGFFFHA